MLELFITLIFTWLNFLVLEAGSKHENTEKMDRDVMKANGITLFIHLAAFVAKC